jgi:hypothetical protein
MLKPAGACLHTLFYESYLIPGCVPRRPNQVHPQGFRHHYAERFTCLSASIFPPWTSRSFSFPRVAEGHMWFIGGLIFFRAFSGSDAQLLMTLCLIQVRLGVITVCG